MPKSKINQTEKNEEETKKEIRRKVKIIAWLLPRFHKGISDPKNYEKLIGRLGKDEF
jgi:hypothetical protein